MCGIFAYSGKSDAGPILLEGLTILQNRGYDSVGIATFNKESEYVCNKFVSDKNTSNGIEKLAENISVHENNKIGLGHCRWATHGGKTVTNAHPHFDASNRFCIVHNGVIENYLSIKKFLLTKSILCTSETDTEVVIQLLGYYAQQFSVSEALKRTLSELEGTWGLVILDKENPDTIIATRKGSPLLIGITSHEYFIASEVSAFLKYTRKYINLNDDEIIIIKNQQLNIENYENRLQISKNTDSTSSTPYPFPYWTIKEIKEQAETINFAINNGGRILDEYNVKLGGLDHCKEKLVQIVHLIIIGCGTSKHAGDFSAYFFRSISGFSTVQVVDASEFDESYLINKPIDTIGLLALSQSGETQDVLRCLKLAKSLNICTFSVVNKVDSSIAKFTNCGVYLNAGREVAVASTKAFTATVTVLFMIAIWFSQNKLQNITLSKRQEYITSLNKLQYCVQNVLNSGEVEQKCKDIAEYLKEYNKCFILGKGTSAAIASEGALKIKEIGYCSAEGYPGGALKHGPFALIEPGMPIIMVLLNDVHRSYMESTINEVKSRNAYVITITDVIEHDFSDVIIRIPFCENLTSLLSIVPLQLIAFYLSISKNINPDKPRNLAKVVTVI